MNGGAVPIAMAVVDGRVKLMISTLPAAQSVPLIGVGDVAVSL